MIDWIGILLCLLGALVLFFFITWGMLWFYHQMTPWQFLKHLITNK